MQRSNRDNSNKPDSPSALLSASHGFPFVQLSPLECLLEGVEATASALDREEFEQHFLEAVSSGLLAEDSAGEIFSKATLKKLSKYQTEVVELYEGQGDAFEKEIAQFEFIDRCIELARDASIFTDDLINRLYEDNRFSVQAQAAVEVLLTISTFQERCSEVLDEALYHEVISAEQAELILGVGNLPTRDRIVQELSSIMKSAAPMSREELLDEAVERGVLANRQEADELIASLKENPGSQRLRRRIREIEGWVDLMRGPEEFEKLLDLRNIK